MDKLFAGLNQDPGSINLPLFETRKALIIINLQNDSLYVKDDLYITKNRDFVPRLKEMIPYFRKHGDVVWVKTHMGVVPPAPASNPEQVEEAAARLAEKNREEQNAAEQKMQEESRSEEAREADARHNVLDPVDPNAGPGSDYPMFYPSSKTKNLMMQASAKTRAEKRTADLQVFDDKSNVLEKHLSKPRKGQQARFYIAGTKGAELCDELLEVVDESLDLVVTKHHYSAFDQTSLLTALRAKLVTEIFLCGCLTNVGVYSTAADAVQHGLQVSVVEDCLGYRSEDKHEEAMRQMADIMGVQGIDSEEIIEESGGRPVPDAETPGITLDELSLHSPVMATRGLVDTKVADAGDHVKSKTVSEEQGADHPKHTLPAAQVRPRKGSLRSPKKTPKQDRSLIDGVEPSSRSPEPPSARVRSSRNHSRSQTLGPNDSIGSGDSRIIHNAIDPSTIDEAFMILKEEVGWQTMYHRSGQVPRLVAAQGELGRDGETPIYRHPADESPPLLPFTPTVQRIRREVEALLNQSFNNALIQLYRNGVDYISEHSDKTLDIVRGSAIVNVSIGAQRAMTLRTKKFNDTEGSDSPSLRQSQRIKLPHNSVFVLGPQTNREWLHGVRADKRPDHEKSEDEKAFRSERISITFRQVGTFMDRTQTVIWGSGARSKTRTGAGKVSKDNDQMEAMIIAFGRENHEVDFDWDAEYGPGFDVVNLVIKQAQLQLCTDVVANQRAQLALCEKSIPFAVTEPKSYETSVPEEFTTRFHPWMHGLSNTDNPILLNVDNQTSGIEGDLAIMLYLEKRYPFPDPVESSTPGTGLSATFTKISQSNELLFLWRQLLDSQDTGRDSPPTTRFLLEKSTASCLTLQEEVHGSLRAWEVAAKDSKFIAGDSWSIVDCALWPVLNHLVSAFKELNEKRYPYLFAYHERVLHRASVESIIKTG